MVTVPKFFDLCGMAPCAVVWGWFSYERHFIMFFGHGFLTSNWFVTIKTLDSLTGMFAVMILLYDSRVLFLMALYTSLVLSKGRSAQ